MEFRFNNSRKPIELKKEQKSINLISIKAVKGNLDDFIIYINCKNCNGEAYSENKTVNSFLNLKFSPNKDFTFLQHSFDFNRWSIVELSSWLRPSAKYDDYEFIINWECT